MLLVPLLLSLSAAPQSGGEELSRRLPGDAIGVVLLNEPQLLWSGDESGGLADFFQDPRWLSLLAKFSETNGELEPSLQVLRHFESVRSAAMGVWGNTEDGPESGLGILRAEGPLLEGLREDGPALGLTFEPVEVPGWDGTAWAMGEGGSSDPLLVAESGGLVYIGWPGIEEPVAHLLRANQPDNKESRWWLELEGRQAGAQLEAFMRWDSTFVDLQDLDGIDGLGPLYLSGTLAPEARFSMRLSLDAPNYLPGLAGCLLPADTGIYGLAGPEHLTVSVLAVDVPKAAEFVLQVAEQEQQNARAEYEGALMAAGSFLGMDMEEDVLANLTGQFVMFQRPSSLDELMTEELSQDAIPTFAFGHRDRETFLLVIESLVGTLANFALPVEFEEHAEGELWTTSLDVLVPGLGEIGVAVDDRYVVLGPASDVRGILERSAGTYEGSSFARGGLQGDKDLGSGFVISATDMAASWDMLEGIPWELAPILTEMDNSEVGNIEEAAAVTSELISIARDHMGGVWLFGGRIEAKAIELDWFGY